MLPTAYEFHWDLGHVLFLGIFYGVVALVAAGLGLAVHRGLRDLRRRRAAAIDWAEACREVAPERRRCRHELAGRTTCRTCENAFACDRCDAHARLAARSRAADAAPPPGIDLPARRLYHRGHTWVEPQDDGTVKVGVDDLAARCFGRPDRVVVPPVGRVLHEGDRGARVRRGRLDVRLFNPVAGEVVEQGDFRGGYLYRLRPTGNGTRPANLLDGAEARAWMTRELEALQTWLAPAGAAPALADGGEPVADLVAACPDADWDAIWGRLCLET